MKMKKIFIIVFVSLLVSTSVLSSADILSAQKITSVSQAKKKALNKVKNAVVTEVDKDYENGKLVYEITLVKGTKKYDITYRASNGKLVNYGWEEREQTGNNTNIISKSACKKLARSKVKKAKIQSVSKKYDDGIYVYVVKMKKGSKKYTLEYAAGTGKLLEYEWKLVSKTSSSTYIGTSKAKKIALAQVTGATLVKIEFDKDDGVPVYEAELTKGQYEYEITIHAKTGKVLEIDKDLND